MKDQGGERLEISALGGSFKGVSALTHVDRSLSQGEVVGLIGPNGAGKTTLINVLSGFQRPTRGSVRLNGSSLVGIAPDKVRRLGISRTFQAGRLFAAFTVRENIQAAALGVGRNGRAISSEVDDILDWLGLGRVAARRAAELPYSDQRRVGLARALVGPPRFVLIDEPAAGMSDGECVELTALLRQIPTRFGAAVVLVEHNVRMVAEVCQSVHVLDRGQSIAHGTPGQVLSDPIVIQAYLGSATE